MTEQTSVDTASTSENERSVGTRSGCGSPGANRSDGCCGLPTLYRAELFTLTGDGDNKDHDTGIYVIVRTSDGKMILASINNADSSGKDMTEYNDDSHHIVPLVVEAPGATTLDAAGFKVRMSIKTNGNDNWTIDEARVTLYFSDGSTLFANKFGFNLDGDGDNVEFSAP